jgi:hypothetical protein
MGGNGMKRIGPFIVMMREKKASADTVLQRAVRAHVISLLAADEPVRAVIAKTGRSAAKDWLEDTAEEKRQREYECPVCHQNQCDGPQIHGETAQ